MTQNQELLPCPHCGSTPVWCGDRKGDEHDCDQIYCEGCQTRFECMNAGIMVAEDLEEGRRLMAEAWNTRAEIPHD